MNILIIEDDSFKCESIKSFLNKIYKIKNLDINTNLSEGIKSINEKEYNLIFVDMAIPSHPINPGGGSPMSLLTGGLDIILELKYLNRKDPCVILTQYPDLEIAGELFSLDQAVDEISLKLECNILACIGYKENSDDWENELINVLGKL